MYHNIKSCVKLGDEQSSFFQSYCGVRQGENLSPFLFAIFLNDLEDYLQQNNCTSINLQPTDLDLTIYIKLLVLLYADDTVVFGKDAKTFQENLNTFYEYANIWKLKINYEKTKIMIFGIRDLDVFHFKLGDHVISICDEFKYLGVIFNKNRSFYSAIKHNVTQAKKLYTFFTKSLETYTYLSIFNFTFLIIQLAQFYYMVAKSGVSKIPS